MAIKSEGTTISVSDGVNPVTIGGIVGFSAADGEAADINVTTLADTSQRYLIGLEDNGQLSLELNRLPDDAGQAQLLSILQSQTSREFVITLPSGTITTLTFDGFVKSLSIAGTVDDKVSGTCNIRIDGDITYA